MRGAAPRNRKEEEHEHVKAGPRLRRWLATYGWAGVRNLALFCGGLLGVLHETLVAERERPTLLLLFAAMMGLPAFLGGRGGNGNGGGGAK